MRDFNSNIFHREQPNLNSSLTGQSGTFSNFRFDWQGLGNKEAVECCGRTSQTSIGTPMKLESPRTTHWKRKSAGFIIIWWSRYHACMVFQIVLHGLLLEQCQEVVNESRGWKFLVEIYFVFSISQTALSPFSVLRLSKRDWHGLSMVVILGCESQIQVGSGCISEE